MNRIGRPANQTQTAVDQQHEYLQPPGGSSDAFAEAWWRVVLSFPPDSFGPCDSAILTEFVQCELDLRRIAEEVERLAFFDSLWLEQKNGKKVAHPALIERDKLRARLGRLANALKACPSARRQSVKLAPEDRQPAVPNALRAVV